MKGLRCILFLTSASEWQPYGSVSNGTAAFFRSPSVAAARLNPVDSSGSTPMYSLQMIHNRKDKYIKKSLRADEKTYN